MRLAQLLAISAVVFVGFFDNFSQFPVVAPYARALGAAPGAIGLAVAIYSVTNLVGNLLAGHLLDHLGRKRLLVAGLGLAGMAVLLYSAARTPGQLVAIRAFHGIAAAILAPAAFTLLGDLFPRQERGRAMGASGAFIALAAMVAPAISGLVRDRWGFEAVFLGVAALLLLTGVGAQLLIGESHRPQTDRRPAARVFFALLGRRSLALAYVSAAALTFGLGTLVTHLPLHLSDLGYAGTQTGLSFSAFALVAMLVMASPAARGAGARGRLAPAGWGLAAVGVALLLLPSRPEIQAVVAAMALYGLGFGLIFPSANAQVADATSQSERGTAFGIFYAFYSIGVIVGASAAGFTYEAMTPISPFHLSAVIALPAAALVLLSKAEASATQRAA